jgi:hypothetical protein
LMPVTAFSVLDHLIALALTAMDVHDHIMLDVSVKINTYLAIPGNETLSCASLNSLLH